MSRITEICCKSPLSMINGYLICEYCGTVLRQHLDTCLTSYNQGYMSRKCSYSRKTRFEKKIIASLRCMAYHKIDEKLVTFLMSRKIKKPEDILSSICAYPGKRLRKPYLYATYYWSVLGFDLPRMTELDNRMLNRHFDQIFFAWKRLDLPNPNFPYSYLMRKIVMSNDIYSDGIRQLIKFVRVLRCDIRKARYDRLFEKCINLDLKIVRYT